MRGQLYCGHANTTALSSSPVVSALSSESDNPGSSPGRGKALCPWDVRKKKVLALLLDLAKSIYYLISQCFFFSLILAPTNQLQLLSSFCQRLENCPVKIFSRYCHMFQSFCSKWVVQLIPYLCVFKGV